MLSKGFILNRKNRLTIERRRLWIAFFIIIGYSSTFYSFSICIRELFRYLSLMGDYDHMLVLSSQENFFYNFFFATIATLTGISFGADSIIKTQFHLPAYVRHSIFNDFSGLLWFSNYWIAKLGLFFGVMGSVILINNDFSFYRDFWFMFPMISIVLFLNQWVKFRFFIKKDSFRIMFLSFFGIIIYSLLLASISIIDYKSLNHSVLKNTISYNYRIDLPKADFHNPILRKFLIREIFLGTPKSEKSDSIALIIKGSPNPISNVAFSAWLENEKQLLESFEMNELTIALNSSKAVTMDKIKAIFEILKEKNVRRLWLGTAGNGTGLSFNLNRICQEVRPDTSFWQPSCLETFQELQKPKTLNIHLRHDSVGFNNHFYHVSKMVEEFKKHITNSSPDYFISLRVDDHSSYQTFISFVDIYYKTIISLREKLAVEKFSKRYDYVTTQWEDPQLNNTLSEAYPMNFIMLSDDEWIYLESQIK